MVLIYLSYNKNPHTTHQSSDFYIQQFTLYTEVMGMYVQYHTLLATCNGHISMNSSVQSLEVNTR